MFVILVSSLDCKLASKLSFDTVKLTSVISLHVSLTFASSFGWLYSVSIANRIIGVQSCLELVHFFGKSLNSLL